MCGIKDVTYKPIAENNKVYQRLYVLYKQLHDAFGVKDWSGKLANVMKELLSIKDRIQTRGA
jgi:L-ribulokinase